MSGYFPRYSIREDLAEGDALWLADQSGDGPLDLADVTDVCATYKIEATLYDEPGFVRGWVHSDGSYRLQ